VPLVVVCDDVTGVDVGVSVVINVSPPPPPPPPPPVQAFETINIAENKSHIVFRLVNIFSI
jgi:hypothetical protein